MQGVFAGRTGNFVEHAASALFGGAVGFAVYAALSAALPVPQAAAVAAGVAAIASLSCGRILSSVIAGTRFAIPDFALAEIETLQPGELLLTDADRAGVTAEPLELDDILAEIGPDSRVVRLFDRQAMPTPGQLKSRIDDHLGQPLTGAEDASEALIEALAELRRSLR